MTGIFRPYPSQPPKRYDATLFAAADPSYLLGPRWDLRAALRRPESFTPQIHIGGAAVFAQPPAYMPRLAVVRTAATDRLATQQPVGDAVAALFAPVDPPYLQPPKWDLRAALRRDSVLTPQPEVGIAALFAQAPAFMFATRMDSAAHRRPEGSIAAQPGRGSVAALLDDLVWLVTPDATQPVAAYARASWPVIKPPILLAAVLGAGPQIYNVSISEAASAADALTSTGIFGAALSEAGSASDVITNGSIFAAVISEAGGATDALSASFVAVAALSESGTGADTISAIQNALVSISESGSAADSLTGSIGGSTFNVTLAEGGAAVDAVSALLQEAALLAESGNAADSQAAILSALATLTQAGAASDTYTTQWLGFVSLAEVAAAIDSIEADGRLVPGRRIVIVRGRRIVKVIQ